MGFCFIFSSLEHLQVLRSWSQLCYQEKQKPELPQLRCYILCYYTHCMRDNKYLWATQEPFWLLWRSQTWWEILKENQHENIEKPWSLRCISLSQQFTEKTQTSATGEKMGVDVVTNSAYRALNTSPPTLFCKSEDQIHLQSYVRVKKLKVYIYNIYIIQYIIQSNEKDQKCSWNNSCSFR